MTIEIVVEELMISPGHNYFGRHGKDSLNHEILCVDEIECVTNRGIKGDRFFNFKENYKGQITFFNTAVWRDLEKIVEKKIQPTAFRRNVLVSGVDLNTLIGKLFTLNGIQFQAVEECRPCYWMDEACAPGAEEALKGNGGLRCKILNDGVLSKGTHLINL